MKKLFFVLCALVAGLSAVNAQTYGGVQIDGMYYNLWDYYNHYVNNVYTTDYYYAEVTSNPNKYSAKVVVPASVEYNGQTYNVKSVGYEAFEDCSNLISVTLPEGITIINQAAFRNCSSLLSVNIPEGVTSIGYEAFSNCNNVTSLVLPNTLTTIGGWAFYNWDGLTSLVIPNSVTSIGDAAFYSCNNITSVMIGAGVESIGDGAFEYCDRLRQVHISDLSAWCRINFSDDDSNPCLYGAPLFLNGEEVNELVIPSDITAIKQYAFYGCSSLTSVVLPDQVESVEINAFTYCSALQSVSLGANIANLNKDAFSNCGNLTQVEWMIKSFIDFASAMLNPFYNQRTKISSFTIGDNVEHIPAFLCSGLTNLTHIDIPASVKSVGEGAFSFCTRLKEINAAAGSTVLASEDGVLFNKDMTSLIVYPAGRSASSYTIPGSVQTIEENAFYGCENLSSLIVPADVTEIKAGNAVIPMWSFAGSTPATIAENAFAEDVYLIVDNVDTYKAAWPEYASRIFPREYAELSLDLTAQADKSTLHMAVGDANLENVIKLTISGTINSYDLMIMRNKMINLRELDLTDASIVANSYEYYTGICSHNDTLLAHSFRGVNSLKLPKTLKYVTGAVVDCETLKYLEINSGVVGDNMAAASTGLEVVLNEGVTGISAYAFRKKEGLRKITINAPISAIPAEAFYHCGNLQEVILPEGLESIGNSAFCGSGLVAVTIPASVKTIGDYAFGSIEEDTDWNDYTYYYYRTLYNECVRRDDNNYWNCLEYKSFMNSEESEIRIERCSRQLNQLTFAPNSQLQSIGWWAFAGCPISGSLSMPDSLKSIGSYAFLDCASLREVSFSDNSKLTSIGIGVFQKCSSLESIRLPQSLQTIRGVAFYQAGLKKLALPNAVKTIEAGAFYGCSALSELLFPTSLQTIGDYAFQGCSSLQEVRVPSTLLSVGDYAFADCDNVSKVFTYTVEPVSINQNTFSCWHNADLYVPTTSYYTYYYNTQWSQFLSLKQFDEEYDYFYINNDYELGGETGTIDGKPDADLNENSGLIVTGDDLQEVGVITIAGDDNGAASIIACEGNLQADELVIQLITKKGNWSYFCFPFDVLLSQLSYAHQYVFKQYDGATRAQYGAGGWINMVGDVLQKGLGYIFQGAQTDTLEIRIPNPKIGCEDYEQLIQAFGADQSIHANWNFIGNPFPSWYDLDALFLGGFSSPVYIWDAGLADYKVYRPGDDEYHFHPYEGFFTQNPDGQDMRIVWSSDGRETKSQADNKRHGNQAPRQHARRVRQQQAERQLIDIRLASSDFFDRTRVVFNANASLGYELGRDAVMMDGGKAPLHIWSIAPDNSRLAINERPYVTGEVALGYDVNEDGYYTLSAARMDKDVIIFDNELQQEVDLSLSDYTFYTEAGTNTTRFGVRRIKGQEEALTDISAPEADEIVNVYTVLGIKLMDNVRRADLNLGAGVYLIEHKDGSRSELTIQR